MASRQKAVYVTTRQKKRLIGLMAKHPELISCRISQGFNYSESQKLWHKITSECNSIPGAKKTWRQWRKTWQDLRSKYKKRVAERNGVVPTLVHLLTKAEKEALGLKTDYPEYQDVTEFVPLEAEDIKDNLPEVEQADTLHSDAESTLEHIVPCEDSTERETIINNNHNTEHTDRCIFNCDKFTAYEEKKIKIKEDFLNFKKEYLSEKLKIMREQADALQTIARQLSK